ncbi:MAG: anhydro-N-acetylmuramic acid kinase [Candidatus Jidaibacter sp.]|nr:anhydro-N-acetylmuramic acid kinase [Candidatus Jidaibacter sp.]
MSGTSHDGVDAAWLETDGCGYIEFKNSLYMPYPKDLRDQISVVINGDYTNLWQVERDLTMHHAHAVRALMKSASISHQDLDLIGFHGQNIKHTPSDRITVQIGNGALLSYESKCTVVYDFRSAHVASGGQGAPLIPVFLKALRPYESDHYCYLNIGGVSNITYIEGDKAIGFDVGLGNAASDDLVNARLGLNYDEGGTLAKSGDVNIDAFSALKADPYFAKQYPKSLDRNAFDFSVLAQLTTEDALATLAEFVAFGVEESLKQLPKKPDKIIVSGGGRKNAALLEVISARCCVEAVNIDQYGLDGDMLEAQAFGYIAARCAKGLPCFIGSDVLSGSFVSCYC